MHAINDGFVHCYCWFIVLLRWKKSSGGARWAELQSYDIKIDRTKQRKHREVYIFQTESFAFIHIHTLRVKQYGNQATTTTTKNSHHPCEVWAVQPRAHHLLLLLFRLHRFIQLRAFFSLFAEKTAV